MPYEIIPLDGSFDTPTSYEVRKISNRFNEGQADDRAYDGINSVRATRQVEQYIVGYIAKQTLERFLAKRLGRIPFYYRPAIDRTEDLTLFICKEYSFQRMSSFGGSGDVYRFSGTFEQVFRLRE